MEHISKADTIIRFFCIKCTETYLKNCTILNEIGKIVI